MKRGTAPIRGVIALKFAGHGQSGARQQWQRVRSAEEERGSDFITSVFGKVFGLSDPEPMGLKRVTGAARSEMYPATTTEFAEVLPGDEGEIVQLRCLLAETSLEKKPLRLAYDADRDGWTASAFHRAVDTFGAAVLVSRTLGGAVIGGYNPRGWIGLGEDRDSMAAFLFTWRDGDMTERPEKLPKVGGAAQAVVDREATGPQFGPDGLKIPLSSGAPRQAFSKLGSYYAKTSDGSKSLFAAAEVQKGKGTELEWLRVYVADGGPEQWNLDGIVWKTSQ